MIEVKELRIGNWVDGIGHLYQIRREHFGTTNFDITEPIHLTPEILEKCGFEKLKSNNEENIFLKERLKIWLGKRQSLCFLKHEDKEDCYYIPNGGIGSLHQLQNLYWCLSGKELEITFKK